MNLTRFDQERAHTERTGALQILVLIVARNDHNQGAVFSESTILEPFQNRKASDPGHIQIEQEDAWQGEFLSIPSPLKYAITSTPSLTLFNLFLMPAFVRVRLIAKASMSLSSAIKIRFATNRRTHGRGAAQRSRTPLQISKKHCELSPLSNNRVWTL